MEMHRRELLHRLNNSTGEELRTTIQEGEHWVYVHDYDTEMDEALAYAKKRLGQ